ncbi:MAG: hypothetical protein ACJ764_14930 [Solirubrobacteraceae bacterium]
MANSANDMRWSGTPGHYEVYYVTLTDPRTGVGVWIRYTMVAPLPSAGLPATCSLWFLAMDPRPGAQPTFARKKSFPVAQMEASREPFELRVPGATLSDGVMAGGFEDVAWDLLWTPAERPYQPVHPLLGKLGVARTVLLLPHADVAIDGTLKIGAEELRVTEVRGGQAHLWGTKHASSWAWAHCNDLASPSGEPVPGAFFDAVSALVPRFGRTLGPNTPVVGSFGAEAFRSTSPHRILSNPSRFDVDGWRFEAVDGSRKLVAEVRPVREQTAGVTYHDPDGEKAYCYNSETASVRLEIHERAGRRGPWRETESMHSQGRCHFEFGTRTPVPGIELLTS